MIILVPSGRNIKTSLRSRNWWGIVTAVEENPLIFPLSTIGRLDPLTKAIALPQIFQETYQTSIIRSTVVSAHHLSNRLRCLFSMIKWDGADEVVEHMGISAPVKNMTPNEAHVSINSSTRSTAEAPRLRFVVRDRSVCMLKKRNSS